MRYLKILENIKNKMTESGLDALMIANSLNTSYIIGSEIRDSSLIITHDETYLVTHYMNKIPEDIPLKILRFSPYPPQTPNYALTALTSIEASLKLLKILSRRVKVIGVDEKYISNQVVRDIYDYVKNLNISYADASHLISEVRTIKIDEDLNNYKKCCTSFNYIIEECVEKAKSLNNIRKYLLENLPETINSISILQEKDSNSIRFRIITKCNIFKILAGITIPQIPKAQELWIRVCETTLNSLNELSIGKELRLCISSIIDQLWREEEVFVDLHGIGIEIIEEPIITPFTDVLVEKGMTLALELMVRSKSIKVELALTMMVPRDRVELLTPPLSTLVGLK